MKTAIAANVLIILALLFGVWGVAKAWSAEAEAESMRAAYAESQSGDDAVAVATGLTNRTIFIAVPHSGQLECQVLVDTLATDKVEVTELKSYGFNKIACLSVEREIK